MYFFIPRINIKKVGTHGEQPEHADEYRGIQVMKNDVIVLGTDGLFNAVEDEQLLKCVYPFVKHSDEILDLELVAEMIANFANRLLYNEYF